MYYPILRGKLNELLALRELATLGLDKFFCPVIEPVREDLTALKKTIIELNKNNIVPVIIVNPIKGDYKIRPKNLTEDLKAEQNIRFIPCYILHDKKDEIPTDIKVLENYAIFITGGVDSYVIDESALASLTLVNHDISPHILKRLKNVVLCGDFFKRQIKNADYVDLDESSFSSLHTYYNDFAVGFGDYTITGEEFSESGGPAYVVTIHISYIDKDRFDEMFIRHYSSYNDGTPSQPGAKFLSALEKLNKDIDKVTFVHTTGLEDFIKLNTPPTHFPGLGQVKKSSIKHHIETLIDYLKKQEN